MLWGVCRGVGKGALDGDYATDGSPWRCLLAVFTMSKLEVDINPLAAPSLVNIVKPLRPLSWNSPPPRDVV